jgi:hypothetical protein
MFELTAELRRRVQSTTSVNAATEQQLMHLLSVVDPQEHDLRGYIHREFSVVENALEEKRKELHREVDDRAETMRRDLMSELESTERELGVFKQAVLVLEALSRREGMVPGRLGGLISEKITFDEFLSAVNAPLHQPPRMMEMLALQLPTQSLQEVCDLLSWTALSETPTEQIFP